MRKQWLGMALVATALALATAPASGDNPPCQPDGSTTLAETPTARVYTIERQRSGHITSYTYGCLKESGSQVLLASDAEPAAVFPAPAISLIGPYVGYAVDTDTDPSAPGGRVTYVEVDDLRPQQPGQEVAGLVVSAGPKEVARVGSLKASHQGAVVWIACPAPRDGPLASDPSGTCSRPGAYDHVYRARLGPNGAPQVELLDKGRAIDPHSLRRARHSSVVWRHGKKTLIAKLR
ncbi:MAG: hypothetical protein QOJ55_2665 [Solirubrobacteraceae bacterium]|nr:hypothetical protein [Solirubrobacteraceae bacterium]